MPSGHLFWYKNAVFYQVLVRAFKDSNADGRGDLIGLAQKLDYLKELGVDCLWIMPTYPSPLVDDGYDISDYYDMHPDYGTLDDFKTLVDETHRRGMRIITDLVMNHTSDQHPWFQSARQDRQSPYRDYYVWSDTNQKYSEARVIFNDSLDSNWTWDETAGQYYWHRFYPEQPDLNYDNPAVQEEMLKVIDFWLDLGIDGFRADAVPYLFEREGTNCDNLPETHTFLKMVRRQMDAKYPDRILLMEANQWPEDLRHYFGDGDEAHMAFHFPIMPRLFMSLRKEDRTSMVEILKRTPPIPANTQWCTFLRNHDELTLEMVTAEERCWMWEQYAPEPRMRLNLGIRRRLAPLLDNDKRKIGLLNSLLFTLPGSPVIYYGDEIGMGDNIWLPDRNGVRTPMQWDDGPNAGFSSANPEALYSPLISSEEFGPNKVNVRQQIHDPDSLYAVTKKMIAIRKQHPAFSQGEFQWANLVKENLAAAAYWRSAQNNRILAVHNLSNRAHSIVVQLPQTPLRTGLDLLSGEECPPIQDNVLTLDLAPYQYRWIKLEE